jgi:protein-disulfide isomerase
MKILLAGFLALALPVFAQHNHDQHAGHAQIKRKALQGKDKAVVAEILAKNDMLFNAFLKKDNSLIEKTAKEKVAYWSASPEKKFDPTKGLSMQKGSTEPVMTIVEFADFRCPHCKHAAPSLHNFTQSHPDVKLIFKPFPLDGTCNEAIKGGGDGISCGLASAVMCSEKIAQKGWLAHDYIFENQMDIIQAGSLDKNLDVVSKTIGISVEDLKKCINDPTTGELIRSMANEGAAAQIQGTPTVFVNGKLLSGGQLIPILESAYKTIKGN